jgi:urea transport system permease protein
MVHRLAAIVVVAALLWLAWRLHREGQATLSRFGTVLALLAVAQVLSGLSNVVLGWPIAAALAHSAGAAALMLVLALLLAIVSPVLLPGRLFEGPRGRITRLISWAASALVGVLFAALLGSQIRSLARANPRNVDVTAPAWMRGSIEIAGLTMPVPRLVIIAITVLAVLGITWFLARSVWGMRIRAVTQNRSMSDCLGIPTETVDVLTFGVGSGLAGVAGVAVSLLGSVGPNVGASYIVGCFMVVVLGGVGNLLGTVIASLAIGVMTDLIGAGRLLELWPGMPSPMAGVVDFFATTSMARVLIFALIVVFLQFRPAGLFPQKGRLVEA